MGALRKTSTRTLKARLLLLKEMGVTQAAFDERGELKAVMFREARPAPAKEAQPPALPAIQIPKALRDAGFDDQRAADLMAGIGFD